METSTGFELTFDREAYIELQGERFRRLLARPGVRAEFDEVFAEIQTIVQPRAAWDRFEIAAFEGQGARLKDGTRIGHGPFRRFMENAAELVLLLCTVGPEVDARIAAHQRRGDMLKGVLLDELATWAVGLVREEALHEITSSIEARGLYSGVPLAPGQSGWSVAEQRTVFSLLDGGAIGVTLSGSYLMRPIKSTSTALGVGPEPVGPRVEGKVPCDFCSLEEHCRYSRSAGRTAA